MEYQVKSGDCLWNIVQQKFGLSDVGEINEKIKQIAEANKLDSPDLIFDGQSLDLGDNVEFSGKSNETEELSDISKWAENEGKVDGKDQEFKMFDYNKDTYAKDLKEFAQKNTIDKFDKDNDGKLNFEEFALMNRKTDLNEDDKKELKKAFDKMHFDEDKDLLTAEELAIQLMSADGKKNEEGEIEFDGQFSFSDFKSESDVDSKLKQKFFDDNYKEA